MEFVYHITKYVLVYLSEYFHLTLLLPPAHNYSQTYVHNTVCMTELPTTLLPLANPTLLPPAPKYNIDSKPIENCSSGHSYASTTGGHEAVM